MWKFCVIAQTGLTFTNVRGPDFCSWQVPYCSQIDNGSSLPLGCYLRPTGYRLTRYYLARVPGLVHVGQVHKTHTNPFERVFVLTPNNRNPF